MSEWERERERGHHVLNSISTSKVEHTYARSRVSEDGRPEFSRKMRIPRRSLEKWDMRVRFLFSFLFFREPLLSNGVWMVCPRVQERKIFFLPLFFRFASRHMIKIFDEANHDLSSVHNSFTIVNKTFSVIFYSFHISHPYSSLSGFFYISSSIFTSS